MMNRDPATITKQEVDAHRRPVWPKDMAKECPEGVTELYDAYLMSVIPMGDDPVQGWEPEALRNFRAQLGLEDADAANAHIEVGRRLFRKRIELGDKDADLESRREFRSWCTSPRARSARRRRSSFCRGTASSASPTRR